ncbi:putative transcription factor TGA like domain-containing protein [Helianthus anomalus]
MTKPENTPRQIFNGIFDCWLCELNTILEQLVTAVNSNNCNDNKGDSGSVLHLLIIRSIGHYEEYYKMKSDAEKGDIVSMFAPAWLTSLEDAFLWIAGWRPTTVIHLLYSKSGIQLEASLANLIPLFTAGDLGDLNLIQLNRVEELQKKTVHAERRISEKMAKVQESAADASMVDLSNAISEMMREENEDGVMDHNGRVESMLEPKTGALEEVVHMADGLRMKTLKAVIEILTPIQGVYFLIAAAELRLRVHDWGLKRDGR